MGLAGVAGGVFCGFVLKKTSFLRQTKLSEQVQWHLGQFKRLLNLVPQLDTTSALK